MLGSSKERQLRAYALPAALVFLLGLLWLSSLNPMFGYTPGPDSGVYLYIGQQILRGAVPYRDVFDNKGPLLYLLNAAGLAVSGESQWGVYALEYTLVSAGLVLAFIAIRRRSTAAVAGLAMLLWVLMLNRFGFDNHEEYYFYPLQCAVVYLVLRGDWREAGAGAAFAVGLLGAGALFLKPTGIGLWVSIILVDALLTLRLSTWRPFWRRVFGLLLGILSGSAAFLVYLWAVGALGGFFSSYLLFNFAYSTANGLVSRLTNVIAGAYQVGYVTSVSIGALWIVTLWMLVARWRRGVPPKTMWLLAVIWLPTEIALSSVSGFHRGQYYLPWLVPMALVLASALSPVWLTLRERAWSRRRLGYPEAVAALVILAFAGAMPALATNVRNTGGAVLHFHRDMRLRPGETYAGVVRYIDSHSRPSDLVLVWSGDSARVNFLADRRSPTRYVQQESLYDPRYGSDRVMAFLDDLKRHPPAMIVDTSASFGPESGYAPVPPITADSGFWPNSPSDFKAAWAKVFAFVQGNYRPSMKLPSSPYWTTYVPRAKSHP